VTMPSVPGARLVVVQPQFVLCGLEAVFDGPTMSLERDQGLDARSDRAPSGEEVRLRSGPPLSIEAER
jgi:hypothetical protein